MADGEILGTSVVISKAGAIVGQGDFTVTYGGVPVDISSKDDLDWVKLLDGELATKQVVAAGTLTYKNDASYEAVKADAFAGTMGAYTITFASNGETLAGNFMPNAMSDALPMGDRVTTAITFSSSGAVTRTPQTIA